MRNYKFISDEWHLSHTKHVLHYIFLRPGRNNKHTIWVNNSEIEFIVTRKWWLVVVRLSRPSWQMAEFTIILITTLFCRMAFNLRFFILAISVCLTSILPARSLGVRCAGFHHETLSTAANCLISLENTFDDILGVNYRP